MSYISYPLYHDYHTMIRVVEYFWVMISMVPRTAAECPSILSTGDGIRVNGKMLGDIPTLKSHGIIPMKQISSVCSLISMFIPMNILLSYSYTNILLYQPIQKVDHSHYYPNFYPFNCNFDSCPIRFPSILY